MVLRFMPAAAMLMFASLVVTDEVVTDEAVQDEVAEVAESAADDGQDDETKRLLAQLTISMVSEILDARTVVIRDVKNGRKRQLLKLGNIAAVDPRDSDSDLSHQERLDRNQGALEKLVGKQMIWWKAAPDEHQGPKAGALDATDDESALLADVWLLDGRYVNELMRKNGHAKRVEDYPPGELSRDILSAEADKKKKDAYKELEKALKENEREKKKAAQESILQAEAERTEPIGVLGTIAIVVTVLLFAAACFNFGRSNQTKKGRKKGFFSGVISKLKGS